MTWYIIMVVLLLLGNLLEAKSRSIRCFLLKQSRRELAERGAERRRKMYRMLDGNEAAQKMFVELVEGRGGRMKP